MLGLLLVAGSLGLSNFAAAIGMGVPGIDGKTRWRVGAVFGFFEAAMPAAGLALGRGLAGALGSAAHWVGAALLIATGAYGLVQAWRSGPDGEAAPAPPAAAGQRSGALLVTGLALSVDNLAAGFALGTYHVSLAVAAAVIGGVSVALSLAGLELGARIGTRTGRYGEFIGGGVLILVGAALGAGLI
jgi:putative Mn2+ efflux pump MntP